MRMTRSAMLEVLREDYIRTARAKGLIEKLIINRHALKNALLPVVTVIGIEFAFLIGGLVVTEQVFNLNGIGRLFVQAVQNQDYTLTQALVMLVVAVFVLTNLVVDLLYAWLDPRIRYALRRPPSWRSSSTARSRLPQRGRCAASSQRSRWHARCTSAAASRSGTFGLVLVLIMAVTGALRRAGSRRTTRPPTTSAAMTEAPSWAHLAGHRPVRPRSAVAHHLRRAHRADRRASPRRSSAASLGLVLGRRQRLFRRPDRPRSCSACSTW